MKPVHLKIDEGDLITLGDTEVATTFIVKFEVDEFDISQILLHPIAGGKSIAMKIFKTAITEPLKSTNQ